MSENPTRPKPNAPHVRFPVTLPQKHAGTRWVRENPEKVPGWARPASGTPLDWTAVCAALGAAFVVPALDALIENQERTDTDAELATVDDKIARTTRARTEADEKLAALKRRRDELVRLPVDNQEGAEPIAVEPPGDPERPALLYEIGNRVRYGADRLLVEVLDLNPSTGFPYRLDLPGGADWVSAKNVHPDDEDGAS